MSDVTIDLQGTPEVKRLLAEFDGAKLTNRTKRALRAGAKPMRQEMRARAKAGKFPANFRKTRTRSHRNPIGVSVSPKSPLSNIFEHGARPHQIAPKHGSVLANASDTRRRKKGFFALGAVQHPGMAARPLIAPAFEAAKDPAEKAIADTLFEGL